MNRKIKSSLIMTNKFCHNLLNSIFSFLHLNKGKKGRCRNESETQEEGQVPPPTSDELPPNETGPDVSSDTDETLKDLPLVTIHEEEKHPTDNQSVFEWTINKDTNGIPVSVSFSSLDDKALILYSFDDEESRNLYTDDIIVDHNCTIKVVIQTGNDVVHERVIEVNSFKVPTPLIQIENNLLEIINSKTYDNIEYRYTTDGSLPTVDSFLYEDKIVLNNTSSIKIVGYKKGWHESDCFSYSPYQEKRVRVFTSLPNVLGISYQGDNHVKSNPSVDCQDYHSYCEVDENWYIAVVSDGAGSKSKSDIGSDAVCKAFPFYIGNLLKNDERFKNGEIPDEKTWDIEFRAILNRFQKDIREKFVDEKSSFDSFSATIIVLVFSTKGYLFAHIGDGRAGVKINGEWKTIMTPHKGEQANQTIFSTTIDFSSHLNLMMSGSYVPETSVSKAKLESFVLMSDGCENGVWTTYQKQELPNGDFFVKDVNLPRSSVLEYILGFLDFNDNERQEHLVDFITQSKGLSREGDDKTILIGNIIL